MAVGKGPVEGRRFAQALGAGGTVDPQEYQILQRSGLQTFGCGAIDGQPDLGFSAPGRPGGAPPPSTRTCRREPATAPWCRPACNLAGRCRRQASPGCGRSTAIHRRRGSARTGGSGCRAPRPAGVRAARPGPSLIPGRRAGRQQRQGRRQAAKLEEGGHWIIRRRPHGTGVATTWVMGGAATPPRGRG